MGHGCGGEYEPHGAGACTVESVGVHRVVKVSVCTLIGVHLGTVCGVGHPRGRLSHVAEVHPLLTLPSKDSRLLLLPGRLSHHLLLKPKAFRTSRKSDSQGKTL